MRTKALIILLSERNSVFCNFFSFVKSWASPLAFRLVVFSLRHNFEWGMRFFGFSELLLEFFTRHSLSGFGWRCWNFRQFEIPWACELATLLISFHSAKYFLEIEAGTTRLLPQAERQTHRKSLEFHISPACLSSKEIGWNSFLSQLVAIGSYVSLHQF